MSEYNCTRCSYVYIPSDGDPSQGIVKGITFENLPDSWACPICGASKDTFKKKP
ncbi:MAG: rubredoxin [Candidatus Omnitrophica bacterium]|nr:rubredoxin [Candidatus Omnitrophota bacterium]